jgi:hypothetical protein
METNVEVIPLQIGSFLPTGNCLIFLYLRLTRLLSNIYKETDHKPFRIAFCHWQCFHNPFDFLYLRIRYLFSYICTTFRGVSVCNLIFTESGGHGG